MFGNSSHRLRKLRGGSILAYGHDKSPQQVRINTRITDQAAIDVLHSIRYPYGNEYCKALVRKAIVNLPETCYFPMEVDGSKDSLTAHFSRLRKAKGWSAMQEKSIRRIITDIEKNEKQTFEDILASRPDGYYLAIKNEPIRLLKDLRKNTTVKEDGDLKNIEESKTYIYNDEKRNSVSSDATIDKPAQVKFVLPEKYRKQVMNNENAT